jgi:phage terminase large subunit-like protein
MTIDALTLARAELELRDREFKLVEAPKYDWYGPDCECPAEARYDDGSCRVHPRARDKQRPPEGDWLVWLIRSGRGFGKTRTGAEWIKWMAEHGPRNAQYALVGETAADVRDIMIEGPSGLLAICPPWFAPLYEPSKRRLTWPNGVKGLCYSAEEPGYFRGPQFHGAWCDEFAKWKKIDICWDNLQFGMRLISADDPNFIPRTCITTTPLPLPIIKDLIRDPDTVVINGSMYENAAHLAKSFIANIRKKFEGTRFGSQEIHGAILEDAPGALWSTEVLENNRVRLVDENKPLPDMIRIVVAVDPSVADPNDTRRKDDSGLAEAGIMIGGLGDDWHGYLLADLTLKAHPNDWGRAAIDGYLDHGSDLLVAEVNNGGALVEALIHSIDGSINYKEVHASRGKQIRAEPISSLYAQGRIHHVGGFPACEEELCTWVPGMKSPNRLDALVWLFTELMLGGAPLESSDSPWADWRGD